MGVHANWASAGERDRGPTPEPTWLVRDDDAVDEDLGTIKSGKEATVSLVRRVGASGECLLALKRYRLYRSSAVALGVRNGRDRQVQSGREKRAIAKASKFGRLLMDDSWARAEFEYLKSFWSAGVRVPYPVQISNNEILMEWLGGENGIAAPRLVDVAVGSRGELGGLFESLSREVVGMAKLGYAHGDLSAYNIIVHGGRPYVIDLPQVVDIALNPLGLGFLERDCFNLCEFFRRKGLGVNSEELFSEALAAVYSR